MRSSAIAFAGILSAIIVFPASAAWQPAGSVDLWPVPTHAAAMYTDFTSDVIGLTARGNADIGCRNVIVSFADGSSAFVFRGVLAPDDQTKVYLPGGVRNVRRIDFDCESIDRGHAMVTLAANMPAETVYLTPAG